MNFAQSSEIPTVDEIDVFYDDLRSDNDMRTSIYAVWIFFENLGERTSIYAAKIVRRRRKNCSLYFANDGFPIENRVIPNEISPNSRLRHIKSLWSISQQMIYGLEYNNVL